MKSIKYTILFCIFFVGALIIGESQIFRLDHFYTPFRYTSLYLQYDQQEQDMIQDTLQAAEQHDVEVFTFIKSQGPDGITDIKIYGSPNIQQMVGKVSHVVSRTYRTLFLEDLRFSFHSLKQLQGIKDVHDFYIIGNAVQADRFKTELINTYAGNFPQPGYSYMDTTYTMNGIWFLMIVIALLFTYYDILAQKKEHLIRLSMGERASSIIWSNITKDTCAFIIMWLIISGILSPLTSAPLDSIISWIGLGLLLFINALLYICLRSYQVREALSNSYSSSRKLLSISYALKLVSIVITIFVISSNLVLIAEGYRLYKQKPFFEKYKDYSYIQLLYRPVMNSNGIPDPKWEESELLRAELYKRHYKQADATMLVMIHELLKEKLPTILANSNAIDDIKLAIPDLQNKDLHKETVYIVMPSSLTDSEASLNEIKETYRFLEGREPPANMEVIYYKNEVQLTAINENHIYGSELVNNPIIILVNTLPSTVTDSSEEQYHPNRATFLSEILYAMTDEEFNQFASRHHLTDTNALFSKTNALQKYDESWTAAKQLLYINTIFTILVLLLEALIITSIIKLEYQVNALELSIKKVIGYSIWEAHRKIIIITILTTVVSITLAIFIILFLDRNSTTYISFMLGGGLLLLLTELVTIVFYIRRMEQLNIQRVLKGGNIG